ncbi:MAG TPA: hypothetical protein VIW21_01085 [Chthoniobacterales bacterium]
MSISRARAASLALAIAGVIACLIMWRLDPREFFLSYLFAFLFWLGIALGSAGWLMIHHLTGGKWGYPARRFFEAAISTLPVLALLFLPIVFAGAQLYPWADPELVSADELLRHKAAYLTGSAFLIRAVVLFAIWIVGARLLGKWSREQDATSSVEPTKKLRRLSGPGLIVYPVTVTFAYVDWVMSMEADWSSTVFPLLVCIGQMLSALAFSILLIAWQRRRKPLAQILTPENFHHLGNLLLTFTMLWAYLAYSQLIVIWSADLPHEIGWYSHRIAGAWRWIAVALLLFHFFAPFCFLLFRPIKRNPQFLFGIAALIFVAHIVDLWWMLAPSIHQGGFHVSSMAPAAFIAIGGIWLTIWFRSLAAKPLIPLNDPRFAVAVAPGNLTA